MREEYQTSAEGSARASGFNRTQLSSRSRQSKASPLSHLSSAVSKTASRFKRNGTQEENLSSRAAQFYDAYGNNPYGASAAGGAPASASGHYSDAAATGTGRGRRSPGNDYPGAGRPCNRCGRNVSPHQSRCPHCGSFQTPLLRNPLFLIPVIVGLVLVIVLSIVLARCTSAPSSPDGTSTSSAASSTAVASSEARAALTDAVNTATSTITSNAQSHIYTSASIINLQSAVDSANTVLADENATQANVESATTALANATTGLTNLLSFDALVWPYYDDLLNTLDSFSGSQAAFNGTITSVSSGTNSTVIYVAVSGDTSAMLAVSINSLTTTDFAVSDGISVNVGGTVSGSTSYTMADGTATDIPLLIADYAFIA